MTPDEQTALRGLLARWEDYEGNALFAAMWRQARQELAALLDTLPVETGTVWDENRDQDEPCVCGHPYYRHFDTYEDMLPVGCKYCGCTSHQSPPPSEEPR